VHKKAREIDQKEERAEAKRTFPDPQADKLWNLDIFKFQRQFNISKRHPRRILRFA
jgi:hypothetical protein